MERFVFNPKTLGEPVGYFSRAVRIGDTLHVSVCRVARVSRRGHARSISRCGREPRPDGIGH